TVCGRAALPGAGPFVRGRADRTQYGSRFDQSSLRALRQRVKPLDRRCRGKTRTPASIRKSGDLSTGPVRLRSRVIRPRALARPARTRWKRSPMPRLRLPFFLSLLFVAFFAAGASAQVLTGVVRDPKDRPIKQARVLVITGTTVIATATTGADGKFGPLTVPAGGVDLVVAADGLRAPAERLTVASTGPLEVIVKMSASAVNESVVVSSSAVDRALSRVTDSVAIRDRADLDPQQTETATDLLRTVPGFNLVANGGRG